LNDAANDSRAALAQYRFWNVWSPWPRSGPSHFSSISCTTFLHCRAEKQHETQFWISIVVCMYICIKSCD